MAGSASASARRWANLSANLSALLARRFRGSGRPAVRLRARRRRAGLGMLAVALLVAGLAGYLLLGSGLFKARDVTVTGAHRLSPTAILAAAQVPDRVPLARLDTRAISGRVARLPAVAAVDVRRQWPGTVRIAVTERVPILAVPRQGKYDLIDAAGVAFASVSSPPRRLPLAALAASGRAGATTAATDPTTDPTDPTTIAVLGVVKALSPALRSAMLRLEASSDSGVTLVLRDGRRVVWGANDRSEYKAQVLAALLKRSGRVYDVSAPDIVTVAR